MMRETIFFIVWKNIQIKIILWKKRENYIQLCKGPFNGN